MGLRVPIWNINFCSRVLRLSELPKCNERPQIAICCLEWLGKLKCVATGFDASLSFLSTSRRCGLSLLLVPLLWGPFVEGPETFSHPESPSKISNRVVSFTYSHLSAFRYRWIKIGFVFPGLSRNGPQLRELFFRVLPFSSLLKNQHFQIAIRFWNAQNERVLGAPWVNKSDIHIHFKNSISYVYDTPDKVLLHVSLNSRSEGNYIAA